ncbi:MAG: histidine kinase dimerization/phospho-acceptor domain-containing protein [Xanthomonadales bacterium]|nr:histidine kinase dimerization/phospho-acceptor domain-containing protein [Xanthomonadales bacterium]
MLALAHLGWRRRLRRAHALALERQRRELAERASQAKSDFLAMVSHEIRTPLTGVLGMAELLVRQPLGAEGRRFAEAIRHGGELLLRLIEDLLVWSRLEAGRLEVERRPVELAALIANVLAIERPLAARKGLELRAELEPGLPPFILGDGLRIEQILLNLVHNAVKFTERGEVALRGGTVRRAARDPGARHRSRDRARDPRAAVPALRARARAADRARLWPRPGDRQGARGMHGRGDRPRDRAGPGLRVQPAAAARCRPARPSAPATRRPRREAGSCWSRTIRWCARPCSRCSPSSASRRSGRSTPSPPSPRASGPPSTRR